MNITNKHNHRCTTHHDPCKWHKLNINHQFKVRTFTSLTNCSENFFSSYPSLQNLQNRINETKKDKTHLVWKQAGVPESSGPVLAERNQPATSFPLSDSVALFHGQPALYWAKPARIRFGSGGLSQVVAKWIRSGSKPVCKTHRPHFWPTLPSQSGSEAAMFAGDTLHYPTMGSTVYLLVA